MIVKEDRDCKEIISVTEDELSGKLSTDAPDLPVTDSMTCLSTYLINMSMLMTD